MVRRRRDVARIDLEGHGAGLATHDHAELRAGLLRHALDVLRDDLGFDTATVFVRGRFGWGLLERRGPLQPWHAVLDPGTLGAPTEPACFPDVRTLPGVGSRLATLGCASAAVIPLPDGGAILLDGGTPCRADGWIERVRPLLGILEFMAPTGSGGLLARHEAEAVGRVFTVCQQVVERPGSSLEELLRAVRGALGAEELFLLFEHGPDLEIRSSPDGNWPRTLPDDVRRWLAPDGDRDMPEPILRSLTMQLGMASGAVAGAFGRAAGQTEALVAGWAAGPAPSPTAMAVVSAALSTARAALEGRTRAVTSLVDQERARMAYALHDGLTQSVAAALMHLEALSRRIQRDPGEALAVLEATQTDIRRALSDLRAILFDLARSAEEDLNPEPFGRYVEDVVKRWRLPARVAVEGDINHVPASVLSVAYAVIREALANAAKHASTSTVSVAVSAHEGDLVVIVGDAGRGFTQRDEDVARDGHHIGLESLRRRVGEIGGSLQVHSQPGKGTRVIARLPIREVSP